MRIGVIGDVHSREKIYDIVDDIINKVSKLVFLGDYNDPYAIGFKKELSVEEYDKMEDEEYYDFILNQSIYPTYEENEKIFKFILKLKKDNPDKVVLLTGNHDAHYLFNEISACSRYDFVNSTKWIRLYKSNKNLFQYAYQYGNKLFTHAGVTNSWFKDNYYIFKNIGLKEDLSNFADILNLMSTTTFTNTILNSVSKKRGGKDKYAGIVWADMSETYNDYLNNMHQFVGHSKVKKIFTVSNKKSSITYCDVLDNDYRDISKYYKII